MKSPRFDPAHEEWSLKTGPNTWLVWKHGQHPDDDQRLAEAFKAELAREMEDDSE